MSAAYPPTWIAQVWLSMAVIRLAIGIFYLDANPWASAFFGVVTMLLINSSISLPKAVRDLHEGQRLVGRTDDTRVVKFAAENDPLAIWPNSVSHLGLLQPGLSISSWRAVRRGVLGGFSCGASLLTTRVEIATIPASAADVLVMRTY
ncbi:MAG: hypothetical protein ACJAXA_002349 [Candidatus Aldehydirespiratoraceae bacterium]